MSSSAANSSGETSSVMGLLDRVCDSFEEGWKTAEIKPRIEEFVDQAPAGAKGRFIEELVAVEVSLMRRSGETPTPEAYVQRFPEHADAVSLAFGRRSRAVASTRDELKDATPGESGPPDTGLPQIPGYQIEGELGRGGMGVVFRARQLGVGRPVALKMILGGHLASREARSRFRSEVQAIGTLEHPGIVPVFEVGEHAGNPYFSMAFVEGESLSQRIAREPCDARSAASLTSQIAEAVHSAHQRGIIHRDLKPSNVLLDREGRPKVTDFGLAKRLESPADASGSTVAGEADRTETGEVLGTPGYMPPEQAAGRVGEIGVRSDVYSLGAILYALLTGVAPFRGASPMETVQLVLRHEPVSPRQLQPSIPLDLETICLKCLSKDAAQRYATAADLAADLQRFLEGRPIVARPVGAWERGWRWCRREPMLATLFGTIALLLIVGISVSTALAIRAIASEGKSRFNEKLAGEKASLADAHARTAQANERRAVKSERDALDVAYASRSLLIQREWERADIGIVDNLLASQIPQKGRADRRGWEWHYFARMSDNSLRTRDLDLPSSHLVSDVAIRPDGRQIAVAVYPLRAEAAPEGDQAGAAFVQVYDFADGRLIRQFPVDRFSAQAVAYSPDGAILAVGGGDASFEVNAGSLTLWNAETGEKLRSLSGHTEVVTALAFSRDGATLASGSQDKTVRFWDVSTGELKRTWTAVEFGGPATEVTEIAFSSDGRTMAAAGLDVPVSVHDLTSDKPVRTIGTATDIFALALSADGRRLAESSGEGLIRLWDLTTDREERTFRGHSGRVTQLRFLAGEAQLGSSSFDGTLRLWDVATGNELRTFRGHRAMVRGFDVDPRGWQIASVDDGRLKFWDACTDVDVQRQPAMNPNVRGAAKFTHDGATLAYPNAMGVSLWNVRTDVVRNLPGLHNLPLSDLAFSADGTRLATVGYDQIVNYVDVAAGKSVHVFRGHQSLSPLPVDAVAVSPDGRHVVSAGMNGAARICDAATGKEIARYAPADTHFTAAVFHPPTGKLLLAAQDTIHIVDPQTWKRTGQIGDKVFAINMTFTADGKLLAVVGWSGPRGLGVWLFNWETGQEVWSHQGLESGFDAGLAIDRDSRRLFVGSGKHVRVWDVASHLELMSLEQPEIIHDVQLSPDGMRLAVLTARDVRLYDARPLTPEIQVERQALGLVRFLAGRPMLKRDVEAAIRDEAAGSSALRETALRYAESVVDDPGRFNDAAWRIARQPGLTEPRYAEALRLANIACELAPGTGILLNTRGACEYRLGRSDEALQTLQQSEKKNRVATGIFTSVSHPTDLALLAMTHAKLGQKDKAQKHLDRARQSLKNGPFTDDADARKIVEEAEQVIGQ